MIDGWKAQMMARGLATQTIEGRCRVLRRFQEYAGTFPWTWRPVDLDDYMAERPTADRSAALWPSERADRITLGSLGDSFAAARDAVGLPKELGLHCLRHSYITHLIEAGYDPAFVQTQAGHAYASVTSVYTSVGDDFKQKTIQKMITRRIARPEEANPDG